jgi:hypothetical protein
MFPQLPSDQQDLTYSNVYLVLASAKCVGVTEFLFLVETIAWETMLIEGTLDPFVGEVGGMSPTF